MSAHVQQMPYYCRSHRLRPNPKAEFVWPPRHTCYPRTPVAQEYKETYSPRPTAAARPLGPAAHTHTYTNTYARVQGHGPTHGAWF